MATTYNQDQDKLTSLKSGKFVFRPFWADIEYLSAPLVHLPKKECQYSFNSLEPSDTHSQLRYSYQLHQRKFEEYKILQSRSVLGLYNLNTLQSQIRGLAEKNQHYQRAEI